MEIVASFQGSVSASFAVSFTGSSNMCLGFGLWRMTFFCNVAERIALNSKKGLGLGASSS